MKNKYKAILLTLLLILVLISFFRHGRVVNKENADFPEQSDKIGELISSIEFQVKVSQEDKASFEGGLAPWISLDEPEKDIDSLIDADDIVLRYNKFTLLIDYPLHNPAIFEISTTEKGFSREQLISEISKKYHEIYKEEETGATQKTIPMEKREGLSNRNETNGKYGVWGHDLSGLDLSSIEVFKNSEGKITLRLGVES